MAGQPAGGLLIVERILRDRDGVWRQINGQRELGPLLRQMFMSSMVSLALYGAVLGSSKGWLQALSSTIKLPVLFLATLAICLPTLYLFNLVFGARLMMAQAVSLIMVCITVTSVLTLAFAPISLFFRITAQSYGFFKLLNIAILVLTASVGLRFLTAGMRALNDFNELAERQALIEQPFPEEFDAEEEALVPVGVGNGAAAVAPRQTVPLRTGEELLAAASLPVARRMPAGAPERPASMTLLYVWILLFGFVGTQLAWTLRPFFGSPGMKFSLYREIDGNFYAEIFRTLSHL